MRQRLFLITTACLLLGVGVWGLWSGGGISSGESRLSSEAAPPWRGVETPASATGTEEDPIARMHYRWMRLHDPATGRIPDGIRQKELAFAKRLPEVALPKSQSWGGRGPANVGGRSRAIVYDETDSSGKTILAAGVSGGIWRTTDGGTSWTQVLASSQRPNVTTMTQDPRSGKQNIWYAGTGEYYGTASTAARGGFYRGAGIYKSTDGGQTWSLLSSTTSEETSFDSAFDYVYRVRVDPSNTTQNEVYAATYGGIQRSTDGGTSWTTVLDGLSGAQTSTTDLAVTSSGVVYATMSSDGDTRGLYRSTDGQNWTDITPSGWPTGQDTYLRTVVAVNPSDESEVWFLSNAPGYGPKGAGGKGNKIGHILWKYDADTTSGDRWTDYSDYLPTRGDNEDNVPGGKSGDFNSQGGYDLLVAVHPSDPSKLFVGGRNLWRLDVSAPVSDTTTWIGGYTYTNSSFAWYEPDGSDPQHPDQHTLAFHPTNPDTMLVGSDGGVHETTDNRAAGDGGVLYNSLNDGYVTTQFYQVCHNSDPTDPTIMGGMQDNGTWSYQTTSTDNEWTNQLSGDGAECEIRTASDGSTFWYLSAQNGQVYQAVFDASYTFQNSSRAFPSGASGQLFVHPYELDPADPSVMYYPGGSSLWRNAKVDSIPSSGWTELTGAASSGYVITALRASVRNDEHVLYYGAFDADGDQTDEPARLYRVAGADTVGTSSFSPAEVTGSNFPNGGYVSDIAVDPRSSDTVLVAISNYNVVSLFYSTDGGQSWTDVEGNLGGSTGPSIRSVEILPQSGLAQTTYYAGTSIGLYSTTALGSSTTWSQEGANSIGNVVAEDVEARNDDGLVVVGTHGKGVYTRSVAIPVELAQFDASRNGNAVTLTWTTASETNNAGFRVQHRHGDGTFERLDFVEGHGTTTQSHTYRYRAEDLLPGTHTFRLQQVDTDGTTSQLRTRAVTIAPSGAYALTEAAPNPVRTSTTMQLTVRESQQVRAAVYNAIGQRVKTLLDRSLSANEPVSLSLSADGLASGVYFVRVRGASFEATRKVVVVK